MVSDLGLHCLQSPFLMLFINGLNQLTIQAMIFYATACILGLNRNPED